MSRDKINWHQQQESILKTWGEQSACYRYMHFKEHQRYKKLNMTFTLPIIIISTLTGTANMAQETFPDNWSKYVPIGIGCLNLIAAIMTTILQFLKITELMESHRVSSVHYGKLSRSIRLQLTLPHYERSHKGTEFVNFCNQEYDRLIEQSPPVNTKVLTMFEKEYPVMKPPTTPKSTSGGCLTCCKEDEVDTKDINLQLARPEIMKLSPIKLYDSGLELSKNKFNPPRIIRPKNVNETPPPPAPATTPVPFAASASLFDEMDENEEQPSVADRVANLQQQCDEMDENEEQPSVADRVANLQQQFGDSSV